MTMSRRLGRGRLGRGKPRPEVTFNSRTNVVDRRSGRMHLTRLGCHVDADRAFDAMLFPLQDVAVRGAAPDEAVVVAAMTALLASAIARNVAEHLGVLGREPERLRHDLCRPWWSVSGEWNRRELTLLVRAERR